MSVDAADLVANVHAEEDAGDDREGGGPDGIEEEVGQDARYDTDDGGYHSPPDSPTPQSPPTPPKSRPDSPDGTIEAVGAMSLVTESEAALERRMGSILQGQVDEIPKFVHGLFAYFEDGMRPGMGRRETSVHLGTKASFVLGTLFKLVREEEEGARAGAEGGAEDARREERVPPIHHLLAPRALDAAMGLCLATPRAWKLAAVFFCDSFLATLGLARLVGKWFPLVLLCALSLSSSAEWDLVTDAIVLLTVYRARGVHGKGYASLESCALVALGAVMCAR